VCDLEAKGARRVLFEGKPFRSVPSPQPHQGRRQKNGSRCGPFPCQISPGSRGSSRAASAGAPGLPEKKKRSATEGRTSVLPLDIIPKLTLVVRSKSSKSRKSSRRKHLALARWCERLGKGGAGSVPSGRCPQDATGPRLPSVRSSVRGSALTFTWGVDPSGSRFSSGVTDSSLANGTGWHWWLVHQWAQGPEHWWASHQRHPGSPSPNVP
jgi:hypothetical protein